jgi:mono/diheme cytochrome c family protein
MEWRLAASVFALALVCQACNPDRDREDVARAPAGAPAAPADRSPTVDTARSGDTSPKGNAPATDVALGDRVFHGQAGGGTCFACHGPDAKGTPLAPNLTDREWLDSDGSLGGIAATIKNGVPKPKKFQAAMPPMGGARLSDEQVNAVAAYIHSLSH